MRRLHLHGRIPQTRPNPGIPILTTQRIPRRPLPLITSQKDTQANQRPRNQKDDDNRGEDSEAVARDDTAPISGRVEEGIGVEALCVHGDVCDTQVERQQQDEHGNGHPRVGSCRGEDNFQ